jgi:hypothetical protein
MFKVMMEDCGAWWPLGTLCPPSASTCVQTRGLKRRKKWWWSKGKRRRRRTGLEKIITTRRKNTLKKRLKKEAIMGVRL